MKVKPKDCNHIEIREGMEIHLFRWGSEQRNIWNAFHPTCSRCGETIGDIVRRDNKNKEGEVKE